MILMMRNLKKYALLIFIIIHYKSYSQSVNDSVFTSSILSSVKLINAADKKIISIPLIAKNKLFIFLSPECPLCQNYTIILNKIKNEFGNDAMIFAIVPGKTYSVESVNAFAKKYKINFTLLIDESLKLSHYLQASTTPEVIFLNNKNELVYKGAVDNWYKSLGKAISKPTENYLQDALMQHQKNESVLIKRTKPVGCLINDY